jgi:hypothetical protein
MSEQWRDAPGDDGMSRFGAFDAIPFVAGVTCAAVAAGVMVVGLAYICCIVGGCMKGGGL